ncbi:hypothetical protein MES4922_140019 [Mesorhizobium ventifaucium]|uniref:UDP-glucose/GDP-mannose dehydrogenase N-terminal domain-containing protein n=1 Tax=Mesorhizobium ventifaucium TaxID=666020 RepID=A0ABN8JDJ2_9HYPH|nr:hypothetical protein MES4922_140019 [Mesorhizobium ventifaucium]
MTSTALAGQVASGRFRATADFAELAVCDVVIICVPTPLTKNPEPDLSFVRNTACTIPKHLRLGQLIVLESTTYPGTTDDVIKPILEETGLQSRMTSSSASRPNARIPATAGLKSRRSPRSWRRQRASPSATCLSILALDLADTAFRSIPST